MIGEAIAQARRPPGVWFNASSATVYRHALDRPMDEATGEVDKDEPGKPRDKWEFSVDVVNRWETALFAAALRTARRIAMRLPMVFGPGRGGVRGVSNIARLGLGGTQGPGNQVCKLAAVDDLCVSSIGASNTRPSREPSTCARPMPNREFLKAATPAAQSGLPAPVGCSRSVPSSCAPRPSYYSRARVVPGTCSSRARV